MKYFIARYFIFLVGFISPISGFSFSLTDSLDIQINRELDYIYNGLYFTNFDSAAVAIDRQADRAAQAGRWHMVISALTLKANCAYYHYYADKTYSILLATEALAKKHKVALDTLDPVMKYRSEINYVRGMHFHEVGDFSRSIASFEIIIANHRNYHGLDPLYLYYVHSFIGHAYLQLMLYDKAYLNYEQGLASLQSTNGKNNSYQYAMVNLLKGQCKEYKAKYTGENKQIAEALALYKNALKLLLPGKEKVSYRGALTSAYNRIASVYSFREQYDSAIYYLNASLKFLAENDPMRSGSYVDFGDIYTKQAHYDKALEFYDKSMAVAETGYTGKHYRKSIPAFKKAEVLMLKKEFKKALQTCHVGLSNLVKEFDGLADLNAIPPIGMESNIALLLDGLSLKARIHFNLYKEYDSIAQLTISLEIYNRAIALIQDAQKNYPDAEYKQNLASKVQPLYEGALEAAFSAYEKNTADQRYTDMIFKLLESNKSTLLRDATTNSLAKRFVGVPEGLLDQESYLKGTITSMRAKLYQDPNDTLVTQWKKDLYKMSVQYDSLLTKIKNDHPDYYEFKYGDQILSLREVKKHMDEETLLIEYFWGDRALYSVGVSQEKMIIRKVNLDDALVNTVTDFIKNITLQTDNKEEESVARFSALSFSLYKKVMAPVLNEWPAGSIKSLVVIPDGMLSYFPFDILLMSLPENKSDFASLPYLLKNYTVRGLFSATLIQPRKVTRDFAYAYLGFAPSYSHAQQFTSVPPNGGVSIPGILTHNVQEVTDAFSYFKGKIFLQENATEKTFKEEAGRGKVLHLSMHAFMNDQEPSFSGLIFTSTDSSENIGKEDGILYLHELYNISLNADLAVLSACETGSGRYARGEGIMSFGRAFCYAGSENIVMSLWKANDQSTSQIMKMFFYNLNIGMTKDEALRQAKLTFINTSRNKFLAHPYYWSAFTFTGNPIPLTSSSLSMWSYLAMILVFLLLAVFTYIAVMRRAQITQVPPKDHA